MYRAVGRLKVPKTQTFKSLAKRRKFRRIFWENIKNSQQFIVYFLKNESWLSGLSRKNPRFGKSTKTAEFFREYCV